MTDRNRVQASASGCLSRIFTLIGLFWVGVIIVDVINGLQGGGDFGDFDFTGGIFPAVAFLFAGRVMRKRAREAAADDTFVAPTTPAHRAATASPPSSERGPTPSPIPTPTPAEERPKQKRQPNRPVPELPPIEPVPEARELRAIEDLELSDFVPDKPMTSEERIKKAREKYLPKRPKAL